MSKLFLKPPSRTREDGCERMVVKYSFKLGPQKFQKTSACFHCMMLLSQIIMEVLNTLFMQQEKIQPTQSTEIDSVIQLES